MLIMDEQSEGNPIRLVLLDDHELFRAGLGRLLTSEAGFEIAGECGASAEALEVLRGSAVDVVLLDFHLGEGDTATKFISAAREAGYRGRFLIVADAADARNSALALKLGASGIFLKSEPPNRLIQAIRIVASGDFWLDQKVILFLADQLVDRYPPLEGQPSAGALEERERKVLLGILEGLTNKKIGASMGLSEGSVKAIVQRLFAKACVRTRSQLVRVALQGSLDTQRQPVRRHSNKMQDCPKSLQTRAMAANPLPVRQSRG
jgi:DNA-binding NarL/FixJ family response regulator